MPIAMTAEQVELQRSIRDWAARAKPVDTVRAAEGGAGESGRGPHWDDLSAMEIFAIAIPAEHGGAGGGVLELASALEQLAGELVPGPILPTAVAGAALAHGHNGHDGHGEDRGHDPLSELAAGKAQCAVAPHGAVPHGVTVRDGPDGTPVLAGTVEPVCGAAGAEYLLLPVGRDGTWYLLDARTPGIQLHTRTPVDLSGQVVAAELDGVPLPARGALSPRGSPEAVLATLAAAEAVGVASWCVRTAAEYANTREQFGRQIGSFQAVKHLCARMLCRLEQATALAWDAAGAMDADTGEHELASAAAAAWCLDAAVDNAKDCVQVLGGIGFTWEHDAHLYLRRALTLRHLLGGSGRWRRRVAELAISGHRRHRGVELPDEHEPSTERAAARKLATELAGLPAERQHQRLAETGYLMPHWPAPYGLDASPRTQLAIDEEFAAAGVARPDLVIGAWAGPTIISHGTAHQRDRFVPPTLRGEITWCQLFSEPGAGSDLAALRTRADRVEGGWALHGQKVWTSLAHEADWAICLARTDQDAAKHRGITYFLVRMDSPGIQVRPLREITGQERFNEVFLDGVFVPDDCVLGEPGDGWRVARSTLASERVALSGGSGLSDQLEQVIALAAESELGGDTATLERLGGLVADGLSVALLELRATARKVQGGESGQGRQADAESSVRKLVGVWHRQALAEEWLEMYGPMAAVADGPAAEAQHEFLLSRCLSIAGGTTQVLLNVVAERVLGLPR